MTTDVTASKTRRTARPPKPGQSAREKVVQDKMMGGDSFGALDELFTTHPEMSSMTVSPTAEQLNLFYPKLVDMPYVKGLFKFSELRSALSKLEDWFKLHRRLNPLPADAPPLPVGMTPELKVKEREIRLILRMANVIGPSTRLPKVSDNVELNDAQKALVRRMVKVRGNLEVQLQDEYFREGLGSDWRSTCIHRLICDMSRVEAWLAVPTFRPVKRNPKVKTDSPTAPTRQVINRLADACFRIYAGCSADIIQDLTMYEWLPKIHQTATISALILAALERKQDQFGRVEPEEDYVGFNLYDRWWSATRSLEPPWMSG